jgi:hypothetical protein
MTQQDMSPMSARGVAVSTLGGRVAARQDALKILGAEKNSAFANTFGLFRLNSL